MSANRALSCNDVRDEVLKRTGVWLPQRTLADWIADGLVRPSVRWPKRRGSGASMCWFSVNDVDRAVEIMELRKAHGLQWRKRLNP